MDETVLLRIFLDDDDTVADRPLYAALLHAARDAGLAGATVSRGIAGFGRSSHIHEIFREFSYNLPIVIEIIDRRSRIETWLAQAAALIGDRLVTIQPIERLSPAVRPAG
jgi:uncharacterized protein